MKNLCLLILLPLTLVFMGCPNNAEDDMMPENNPAAIVLDCRIDNDMTLTDQNPDGVDYIIDCKLEVYGGLLTIQPGTHIQMNAGASIDIDINGAMSAVGNSDSPIIIKGAGGGTDASWGHIYFNTNNANNRLDHVIIENGGTEDILFFDRTTVALEGVLSMTNTTVRYSGGNGFTTGETLESSDLRDFRNNTFTDNAGYPISVNQNQGEDLDLMTCTFSGNENPFVQIGADQSGGARLAEESTWSRGPIPYFVRSRIDIQEGLTIEAGTELVFGSEAYLGAIDYTGGGSYLTVNGTADNHVIMRGEVSTEGAWPGLLIETTNVKNVFNFLDLSDGGQIFNSFGDAGKGNVTIFGEEARLTMNDCTSTRAECDVVIDNTFCCVNFINNSPAVTEICGE